MGRADWCATRPGEYRYGREAPGRRGSVYSPSSAREPLMSFYPVTLPDVTPGLAECARPGLLGRAGMVAVRVANLARSSPGARTALTAAGAGNIAAGEWGGAPQPVPAPAPAPPPP